MKTATQVINKKLKKMFKHPTVNAKKFTVAGLEIIDLIAIEVKKEVKITCRGKKCDYCCKNSLVGMSYLEYMHIIENVPNVVPKNPLTKLSNSIMRQHIEDKLDPNTLGNCPFLADGVCQIYEFRPISCRFFFSLDDPKLCEEELSHNLINSSSNNGVERINEAFQQASVDAIPDHAYLDIRDFFMSYKQLERQCNDAPARSREEAEKQFKEKLMGEAKLQAVATKINDGKGETLAWSELLADFLGMGDARIEAALKRLSPKQLLTLEQATNACRIASKESAIERARMYMLELGITPEEVVGTNRPQCAEIKKAKRKPCDQRPWVSKFRKELYDYYLEDERRVMEPPATTVDVFIDRYPDLTNVDVSKGKNSLQSNKGIKRASDFI